MLMLAENEDGTSRDFYSLSRDQVYKFTLPEASGKKCFFSQGWLLTIGKDLEVNLLNPLTRSQIPLPSLNAFPDFEEEEVGDMQGVFIAKFVLSSSPSSTSDYVVMVLHGATMKLAFYRASSHAWTIDAWTIVDTPFARYLDIIQFKRQFYAVNCRGKVLVCDVNGPNRTRAEIVSVLPDGYVGWIEKLYLVESHGRLSMVSRDGTGVTGLLRPLEVEGSTKWTYGATGFQVFELDDDGNWKEIKSIGDDVALFLGDNSSLSIDIPDFPGCNCMGNSIYFTDDCRETYFDHEVAPYGGGLDMGVYNSLDGSIGSHFKGKSVTRLSPPLWVLPTF